ncbi:uncharacterized protein [Drosophila kikkawai]|uniref:Uncharacterized protein LOC108081969 n=1 Tax=Drosophila kikkawai TaxID=30033 RepID=A0A6P4JDK3_DROKI|nr:uncharacterized protein LOC108081969 [Drosophila kikkawai]XP_041631918.1 uncharacterized protein LOC108081969 [Drosophila kikkawai]
MKSPFLIAVLYFSVSLAYVHSPVYNTICKRTGGSITCYQNNTWGFNERNHTCYPVPMNKEPCGFFDGVKGCEDFCLKSFEYIRRPKGV